MSRARAVLLLVVALALQLGLSLDSLRGNSATFDEGAHLPAGYTHLVLGDHRLNPEQPPLVKLLAALPLVAVRPVVHEDDRAWTEARQWEFGQRFLYRWNDADRLLFLGRVPIVLLAAALVALVFFEARRRFGGTAAAVSLGLAALSPDVLAHGSLVTTDLGFALFFFLAVAAFARLCERATAFRLLAAGAATGAAFATKFSAPILVPVLALVGLFAALDGDGLDWALLGRSGRLVGRGERLLHLLVVLVAVGLMALAVVWAAYGFRRELSPDPAVCAALRGPLEGTAASLPARFAVAAAHAGVLPDDYARGAVFVLTHSEARPTFLLGELSERRFPRYFVVTFLLKTPVPLLVLALVALLRIPWLRRRDAVLLWLPAALYVGLTFTRGLQIGHRHLLPVYPFLFLAAGEAAAQLVAWRRLVGVALLSLLGLWYAGGTLLNHPHHLAYFNEIGGGPAEGWRLLADSNVDWGQDLKRLAGWMRANGVLRLKLSYFGSALASYYGIESEALPGYTSPHAAHVTHEVAPGDVLAVSVTNLQGVYLAAEDRPLLERIRRETPIARVGRSIFVYRASFRWPAQPTPSEGPRP